MGFVMARTPITHLILPAAGFGTRMRDVAPDTPKELLPLGETTVLGRAVMEAETAGLLEVVVVIRQGKEALWDFLEDLDTSCRFTFVYQDEPLGECDAVACARHLVGEEPFAVLYPDNVAANGPGALKQLLECVARFQEQGGDAAPDMVALSRTRPEHLDALGNAGRVDLEALDNGLFSVLAFLPKGEGRFVQRHAHELRSTGLYVTGPHFFEAIDRVRAEGFDGELTDGKVRRVMLASGRTILGCLVDFEMLDAGNPDGYELLKKYSNIFLG